MYDHHRTYGLYSYLGQIEKRQEETDTWAPGCPDLEVAYVKLHFGYMDQTITAKLEYTCDLVTNGIPYFYHNSSKVLICQ